ncbi:dienelactone hydrolase family protein [Streptomyces durmitorensis]|uniref:Hydrolase n=1 Tax=Streptomyces durmitorensis TaxID=319947 RepID=A0ABY4PJR0_9ACTN|nr:hydrolase [Streptomyces durmitorensis]UQT53851.1 hydrolase [Streptomyces durmitorensis]
MLSETVTVPNGEGVLIGELTVPDTVFGVAIIAHGSDSSRHSPRDRAVADALQDAALGTLLIDLLTADEEAADWATGRHHCGIGLLTHRLIASVDWLAACTTDLPLGLFGASTGGAAALGAAAARPGIVDTVVCPDGRPDLAGDDVLGQVRAPVLLLAGGRDTEALRLTRQTANRLRPLNRLRVIPDATDLFQEPQALDEVAAVAARWFAGMGQTHL